MRTIKFRMWDAENLEMIDGDSLAFEQYAPITQLLSQKGVMQFTGLYDKNGVEIYEGDKLNFEVFDGLVNVKGTASVYFDRGCFRLNEHHPVADYSLNGEIKVIGNIYEGIRNES